MQIIYLLCLLLFLLCAICISINNKVGQVRDLLIETLLAIKTSTNISNDNEKILNLLLTDYVMKGNDKKNAE